MQISKTEVVMKNDRIEWSGVDKKLRSYLKKGENYEDTVIDIQNRRSVKEYKPEQITDEELMAVLNAGMNAPSGGNKQSPVFIAVQNPEWIKNYVS